MYFDFGLLLFVAPAMILGAIAQAWIRSAYATASRITTRETGARAAERMLAANGLTKVAIEQVQGHLSDHYDPRDKVVRLSDDVFLGN